MSKEELTGKSRQNARKSEMRSAVGEMDKGAALHVHEGFFAGRVHELENKRATIGRGEVEIIVVLTRQGAGGDRKAVEFAGSAHSFGRRKRGGDARFGKHEGNCNCAKGGRQMSERAQEHR